MMVTPGADVGGCVQSWDGHSWSSCWGLCSVVGWALLELMLGVVFHREQMLQVLLRVTDAVMKRPQEGDKRDVFAQNLAGVLFRVSGHLCVVTLYKSSNCSLNCK